MTKAAYHQTSKAPLATEVDYARMDAILARHRQPKLQLPEVVGESPKEKLPALEWEPVEGRRGYYSLCKRYAVSSVTVAGREYFEASKLAGGGAWYYPLAQRLRSFAEAERIAQADAYGARA